MILNNHSYAHKQIRLLCYQLELFTGMKMITDLSEEFDMIRFENKYSYLVINYLKNTYVTLSYHLDYKEEEIIADIMLHCNWLDIGHKIQARINKKRSGKYARKK